jgi:hypothetical protein
MARVVRRLLRIRWLAWELAFRLMFLIALFKNPRRRAAARRRRARSLARGSRAG